jgi:O-antigen ligase
MRPAAVPPIGFSRPLRTFALQAGLGVGLACTAALALGLLFSGSIAVRASVIAFFMVVLTLEFSGNVRLACLYGAALAAPLELSKNFMINAHQGGAFSLRIDLVDLFIVGLLAFQLDDLIAGRRDELRFPRLSVAWIVLMVLGLIVVMTGPNRTLTGLELVRMFKCLVLFLVLVNELRRVQQFGHVVAALMLGVLLQSVIAILQLVLNRRLGLQVIGEATDEAAMIHSQTTLVTREAVNRVGGLLGHPNVLAVFLALILPVGIAVLFTRIDVRLRALSLVAVLVGTAALIGTLSRTGWVGYGVALLGVLSLGSLFPGSTRRHGLKRLLVLVAIGIVLVGFSRTILLRLFYSDEGAVRVRWEWADTAWQMVKDKPILGHGLNQYTYHMAPYTKYGNIGSLHEAYGEQLPVVHNNYLIVWSEQGTVGFIAFLALQFQVIRLGLRNLKVRHETLFAVSVGCLCGLFAMMLDWITSFSLRLDAPTRMYWVAIALLCAVDYWWRETQGFRAQASALEPTA